MQRHNWKCFIAIEHSLLCRWARVCVCECERRFQSRRSSHSCYFNLFVGRAIIFSTGFISNPIIVFVAVVVVAQCRCFRHHFNQNGIPCDQMPHRIEPHNDNHICAPQPSGKNTANAIAEKWKYVAWWRKNKMRSQHRPPHNHANCAGNAPCERRTVSKNGININLIWFIYFSEKKRKLIFATNEEHSAVVVPSQRSHISAHRRPATMTPCALSVPHTLTHARGTLHLYCVRKKTLRFVAICRAQS